MTNATPQIAYFSMEVGLEDAVPTYSGGLGVLAGDTLRAAADLELPVVGVTLLHRRGYIDQRIEHGEQVAHPVAWDPTDRLLRLPERARVEIAGRDIELVAWRYDIEGVGGHAVPVFLLDADLAENDADDRALTNDLYGGDDRYRLAQEIVLGVGGRRMLKALGFDPPVHHLNEGHAALLALELVSEQRHAGAPSFGEAVEAVRRRCAFTTHTPVAAGHDSFPLALADEVLPRELAALRAELPGLGDGELNMTEVALALSGFVNGVAERHAEVSRQMFPGHEIHAITNGVHAGTWASEPMQELFDEHVPGWRRENARLRGVQAIPVEAIQNAHREAKRALLAEVDGFDLDTFTIGFARRATPYKRASLLFRDRDRLREIATRFGALQLVFAGKAHPHDAGGQALIAELHQVTADLAPDVKFVYLPNYGMRLGGLITAGVDLWLNTPRAPMEASGTSGMKAALNGVPNLSVRDGWWGEGAIEGVTGWTIEPTPTAEVLAHVGERLAAEGKCGPTAARALANVLSSDPRAEAFVDQRDADQLYRLLDQVVLPRYYGEPASWAKVMRSSIAHAASHFHAQRMVEAYARLAYRL